MMKPLFSIAVCTLLLVLMSGCLAVSPNNDAKSRGFRRGGHADLTRDVTVLLTGDSLMESMGPQLKECLNGYRGLSLIPVGKKSTGLCRPDFYNWPAALKTYLNVHRPDLVIMWVGTNDNQNVKGAPSTGGLLTDDWKRAYYGKMYEIMALCARSGARLIFIGPPVLGDPGADAEMRGIARVMEEVCRYHRVPFLNTRPVLGDSRGNYRQRAFNERGEEVMIRYADRVHITEAGNVMVIDKLLPLMTRELDPRSRRAPSFRGGRVPD